MIQKTPTQLALPLLSGSSLVGLGRFSATNRKDIVLIQGGSLKVYYSSFPRLILKGTTPMPMPVLGPNGWIDWSTTSFSTTNFKMLIGDINQDGWEDILLWGPNGLRKEYICNGNGTFTETNKFDLTSQSTWHGPSVNAAYTDIDNDGRKDIIDGSPFASTPYVMVLNRTSAGGYHPITHPEWVPTAGMPFKFGAFQQPGRPYKTVFGASGTRLVAADFVNTSYGYDLGTKREMSLPADVSTWAGPFVGNLGSGPLGDFLFASPTGQLVVCRAGSNPTCALNQVPSNFLLGTGSNAPKWAFVDMNNDGYEDLVAANTGTTIVYTNNKKGTGWIVGSMNMPVASAASGNWTALYGDASGDGIADILRADALSAGTEKRTLFIRR